MRSRKVALAAVCCGGLWAVCVPTGFAQSPTAHKVTHRRHRGRRAARRLAGKPKPAAWTLSEYSKGKLHKLKAGSPYYGLLYRYGVGLQSHKEVHGYKWTEARTFECEEGSASGTVQSNSVASPEVALEKPLEYGRCPELSTYHPDQLIEEFTPWSSSEVRFNLLPARLTLESGDARLTPGSDFEVEVVDLIGGETTCKYFSLNPMVGSVTPGEPGEAQQLGFNFSAKFAPEQFGGPCPEEAYVFLLMRSHVGPYGPAMFAEYG